MKQSSLFPVTYQDLDAGIRVKNYADTIVCDEKGQLCAIRFGGYPEAVRSMSDGIWGGGGLDADIGDETVAITSLVKQYRKQVSHNGVYAEATLVADDEIQQAPKAPTKGKNVKDAEHQEADEEAEELPPDLPPRTSYIFCESGDMDALFREVDRKTACPLIPEFQKYVLSELQARGILKQLEVKSAVKSFDAWALHCTSGDENIIAAVEEGLSRGIISVPGIQDGPTPFHEISSVMQYLSHFGVVLAERIKKLFVPLFDPATQPLSAEILEINDCIKEKAGYALYDAQLAVAEAVKRQIKRSKIGLIIAECGSGKTKIGTTALGALWGLHAQMRNVKREKSFGIVLCPSHMKSKWVREIEETLPNTFASAVDGIADFDRLYQFYEQGDRNCYAIISKEKARDGYMRRPAVSFRRGTKSTQGGFRCPECGELLEMNISDDGAKYTVPADQFFFMRERDENHKCAHCGAPLWTVLNPYEAPEKSEWVKIGDYGFVYRTQAAAHLEKAKNEAVLEKIQEIVTHPEGRYPAAGAHRAYPLSTYIKNRYKGRINGLLCDEVHQYSQNSGQGDAMGELCQVADKVIGMTATLINGYSSGIFYLLYRLVAPLMKRDGKEYGTPSKFNDEYGVVQSLYETKEGDYNANRRTLKVKKGTRQLPGVSPLVYSRFLLEYAVFLSLTDMGKDLPEYEEIPIPLKAEPAVMKEYTRLEKGLKSFMKVDRKAAKKVLSSYMNLLVAYPDQPYNQPPILHPFTGEPIVTPRDTADYNTISPKDAALMDIVDKKMAAGEKVLIYTNWTRLDTQRKLKERLTKRGYRTEIMEPKVKPDRREKWVADRVAGGVQVLITNPSLCETGLDLNDFTTIIFYDTGYKLFTFRQASRRSWRINQMAPRVEVYILYYMETMQHKAVKLMANKLAVAGVIEGNLSDEGLAAMSESEDMTAIMARELSNGIKDSVEDVASMFRKMAFLKPEIREQNKLIEVQPLPETQAEEPRIAVEGRSAVVSLPFARPVGEKRSLVERSEEEIVLVKKSKKKAVFMLEGQCSMFDGISA